MKTYKHINDCWNAIRDYWENQETTTRADVEYIKDLCDSFPKGLKPFGKWFVADEGSYITVTYLYWEPDELSEWHEESEDFEVDCYEDDYGSSPLYLELDDLINYDEGLNNIAVDKQVFDDFDEGAIVMVYFVDLPDDSPLPKKSEYQMESEDECCIYMTIFA